MEKKMKTNRIIIAGAVLLLCTGKSFAGGFITNTNQSVSFLRQPAQNAVISVNSAYFNPAGVGFLDRKFHLSFGVQNCTQTRSITANYLPLEYGNTSSKKLYKGKSYVPVFPTLDAAWRFDSHFFASAHFGVIGGGGKADFDEGLSSFEGLIAIIPAFLNRMAGSKVVSYNSEMDITAKQYIFGGQINVGYQVADHFAVSVGLRANYAWYNTDAFIGNIQISGIENFPQLVPVFNQFGSTLFADRKVDCTQTDWGWTPVIGIDYKFGNFNFAARYEATTRINLKNDTRVCTDESLTQYRDGRSDIANDIPGIISLGAQWAVTPQIRTNVGFNLYLDKQARYHDNVPDNNDRSNSIKHNSFEVLAGVEYDIDERFTASLGGQITRFRWGNGLAFITDQSFNISSYSIGGGIRYKFSDVVSFDAAVFKTFYARTKKSMDDYNAAGVRTYNILYSKTGGAIAQYGVTPESLVFSGTDTYDRTNTVLAVGVNLAF